MAVIDHVVVAAPTLAAGEAWVADRLGVGCHPGGRHAAMATHNRLLRLGERSYLEVTDIDRVAAAPARRRWFGLDDPVRQARLARAPEVVAWVVAVTDIDRVAAGSPLPLGPVAAMRRDRLAWRITIPANGDPPEGGAMPMLIEWPADRPHPATTLPDSGCRLRRLRVGHPAPDRLNEALATIGCTEPVVEVVAAAQPALAIAVETSLGVRRLGG